MYIFKVFTDLYCPDNFMYKQRKNNNANNKNSENNNGCPIKSLSTHVDSFKSPIDENKCY